MDLLRKDKTIYRVGLTGAIGAGKSQFAELLRREGVLAIDLDDLGRKISRDDPTAKAELAKISPTRDQLRRKFFGDKGVREQVEAILHPLIWNRYREIEEEAEKAGTKLIVCEAALLADLNLGEYFDELLVVQATDELRRTRVLKRPGMTPILLNAIESAQMTDVARRASASKLIDNTGDMEALNAQAHERVSQWRRIGRI